MICRMGRAQRNPSSWPVIARGMMGFAALYPSYIGVESSRGWRLRLGRRTCRAATDRADDRFGQHRFRERLGQVGLGARSEEHTSELQSLMSSSYAVFCVHNKTST